MFGSRKPEGGRAEKQVRRQARGLAVVGSILLLACMAMTGVFGWGLGTSILNSLIFAAGLSAADLAGAYFFSSSGTCHGAGETKGGRWALATAMVCFVVTLSGVVGFLADNRESVTKAREKAIGLSDQVMNWSQSVVTARSQDAQGKTKAQIASQAEIMASGIEVVGQQAKAQIKMLNSGELLAVADGQSTVFARILSLPPETVRSWTTISIATALLIIQYACWYFQGFLKQRVEPAVVARASAAYMLGPRKLSANKMDNPDNPDRWAGYTQAHARADLTLMTANGLELSERGVISNLGKKWGWSPQRVRRFISDQREFKLPPPRKRQPRQVEPTAESFTATKNGRVHA